MTATAPTCQPLTLGQKQELRGRWLTQYDPETGFHYCVDCLSDLPHDHLWHDHVCTDTPVCLDGSDVVEALPEPVVHKTRTAEVGTEALTGHVDWYGQHLGQQRTAEIIDANVAVGALLTCHSTLPYGLHPDFGPAVCAGFWAKHRDQTGAGRLAEHVLGVVRVDPPNDPDAEEATK